MKLAYLGNSCIQLTTQDGTCVISDPYDERPDGLEALPADLKADAVTVSHIHEDHNNVKAVGGNPQILTEPGTTLVGGIKITGFMGWEGSPHGPSSEMRNIVFMYEADGVKVVQLGDSGNPTDPEVLKKIEDADLIMVNIDGYVFAHQLIMPFMKSINARSVLLGHYTLEGWKNWCGAPTPDEFVNQFASAYKVQRLESEIEIVKGMPEQILIMSPLMLMHK